MFELPKILRQFKEDSLYRNSIYLMASTLVMAAFGFLFWMINARLYSIDDVGLGTTLISVISLITTFSLLGINTALIRFLPASSDKNKKINTAFTLTSLITIIASVIFIIGIDIFSPKLSFLKKSTLYSFLFIFSMVAMTLFAMIDSVFIAYRNSFFVLLKSLIFSIGKIIFPFLLVTFGAFGIFGTWTLSAFIGFIAVAIVLIIKYKYVPEPFFYDSILKKILPFSFANYISGFIGSLPTMLLPLIIAEKINLEATAHYYMAMMIANIIFIIPQAVSQSLFAEGSTEEEELSQHIKKAIKIITLLLVPAILITFLFGSIILSIFGKAYVEGASYLQILALASILVSANSILGTVFRVANRNKAIIFNSVVSSASTLIATFILLPMGLTGIGIAFVIGQVAGLLCYLVMYKKKA